MRAIEAVAANRPPASDPAWMTPFLESLAREDLSPATVRGYRYDLRHFLAWHGTVQADAFGLDRLTAFDLIAYRQHMVAAGRRPATINRRLDALRRLCRWARRAGTLSIDAARGLRPVRLVRSCQPVGLTDPEVHALLRAAGRGSRICPTRRCTGSTAAPITDR